MKLVFICQVVDENDPVQASTVRWLEEFAKKPTVEKITVIALRKGTYVLPEKISVHTFHAKSRLKTLMYFYRKIFEVPIQAIDLFFIYQSGPYPLLLLPFRLLLGKPVFQWYAHPHISPMMKFCMIFCNNIVFTSTRNACPLNLSKVKVVGQGIDTTRFCVKPKKKTRDLVTVSRVAPVKRLDLMLRALAYSNRQNQVHYRLDIYGPTLEKDHKYRVNLLTLTEELGISDFVCFRGPVSYDTLPEILNSYRVFLNFSATALDRSSVEAMACGVPVISTNNCMKEILPQQLREFLVVPPRDVSKQAAAIHYLLSLDDTSLAEIGNALRDVVVTSHGVETLVDKIIAKMTRYLPQAY